MSIYHLPHGQYSYSGHVINLPQDVASFATSLPRLPSELDVVVMRKEGGVQSHRDFCVRRSVVHLALQWLVANNIYYRNVHIDPSALALLPQDDDLSGLHSMTVDSPSDDSEVSSTQDVDPYDANLSRTFVPLTPPRMTEQEAIRQSVQERQPNLPSTVAWPPAGETPIIEFRTEGIFPVPSPLCFQQVQLTL